MDQALTELLSKQEITETLFRIARGTDRGDVELYAAGFHEDATDFHGILNGPASRVIDNLARSTLLLTQHSISNILIELDGNTARVESLFTSFHQAKNVNGDLLDETLRGRYLDLFERRKDGPWKIARRVVLWDWSRVEPSGATWFDRMAERGGMEDRYIFGRRDREDMSYTYKLPPGFDTD